MKTVKFFFLAMAMTIATSASAQFAGGGASKSASGFGSSSATLDPKVHFTAEFRGGSIESKGGFGFTLGAQKDIVALGSCPLAWDLVNVEYSAPFKSPSDFGFLAAKTGLRLFTPSFAGDMVRLYTNLSMGYSLTMMMGDYSDDSGVTTEHGFGLTYGVGFQYNKKINIGYTLQYETACKNKSHFATIGYTF